MTPAVSVVLAARNEAARIQEALDSVLAQTLVDFELIVVDDGSLDATADIVEAQADERIRLLRAPHSGLAGALNRGLGMALAPFVARQDADDASLPPRLERQASFLGAHPGVAVVGTRWQEEGPDGEEVRPRTPFTAGPVNGALLRHNPIAHSTAMFRREAVQALGGYDERLPFAQDYDLWLRLAATGASLWNLDELLAIRRMTGANVAARKERAQIRSELSIRRRDLVRRAQAGEPVGEAAARLARRAAGLAVPLAVKRARRRARKQAI